MICIDLWDALPKGEMLLGFSGINVVLENRTLLGTACISSCMKSLEKICRNRLWERTHGVKRPKGARANHFCVYTHSNTSNIYIYVAIYIYIHPKAAKMVLKPSNSRLQLLFIVEITKAHIYIYINIYIYRKSNSMPILLSMSLNFHLTLISSHNVARPC